MFRLILSISLVAFLGLVGASPEPAAAVAGCHGAPHGRLTVAQRIAARQTVRQDARASKRAAKASCHGEQ